MSDNFVLGIDLGTTFSCVGVYHKDHLDIVENEFGSKVTSSIVTFVDNEIFIGNCPSMLKKGAQVVHNIKRFIGKKFDDEEIQHEMENYSCKLVEQNGGIAVELDWQGGKIYKSPVEISSMILKKLKELAEQRYNSVIKNCVISVPARFNNLQREETKIAGELAGLNVLQIVNEPTAAAHSFGVKHLEQTENKNVMVYDFGGGTLDVSILTITNNCFTVRGTSGNMHLGGEDMNDILEQFVLNDIKQNYPSTQINKKLKANIRKKCEDLKCQLSLEKKAEIYDETILSEKQHYTFRMTRAKFESLCKKVFLEAMKPIHSVLKDTQLSPDEIDEIVMVGGSSKIPKIREMVENIFKGKTLNTDINPLESVAHGTTVMAANTIGLEKNNNMKAITLDVTPLTMGIEVAGKFTKAIIKRGTMFPCQKTSYFTTHEDNQETVTIKVLEGERYFSKDNHLLGQFQLKNLPKKPRGSLKIEVQYHIDRDGILNIQANSCGDKTNKQKLSIRRDDYFLNKESIEQMEKDAALFYKQDSDAKKRRHAIETYENYLFTNFQNIGDNNKTLSNLYQKEIQCILHDCNLNTEEVEQRRTIFEKELREVKNELNMLS